MSGLALIQEPAGLPPTVAKNCPDHGGCAACRSAFSVWDFPERVSGPLLTLTGNTGFRIDGVPVWRGLHIRLKQKVEIWTVCHAPLARNFPILRYPSPQPKDRDYRYRQLKPVLSACSEWPEPIFIVPDPFLLLDAELPR